MVEPIDITKRIKMKSCPCQLELYPEVHVLAILCTIQNTIKSQNFKNLAKDLSSLENTLE